MHLSKQTDDDRPDGFPSGRRPFPGFTNSSPGAPQSFTRESTGVSSTCMSLKLLVSIGAEGGAIALYGDVSDSGPRRYRVVLADQTPIFLENEEGGAGIRKDSGWLSTWPEAMRVLDRYAWPHLACLHVDPTAANAIWNALEEYIRRSERPIRESALRRWREACGVSRANGA